MHGETVKSIFTFTDNSHSLKRAVH